MADEPCSTVSATIEGHTITVGQRDLQVEDFNDNVESSFFDDDFTIVSIVMNTKLGLGRVLVCMARTYPANQYVALSI